MKNNLYNKNKYLILFDGDCGICNKSQIWIQRKDKYKKFDIYPYQIFEYSKFNLTENDVSNSVYVIKNGKIFNKSKAVFEILKELPSPFGYVGMLFSNPIMVALSNPIYSIIAKNRAKISNLFGLNSCKLNNN